MSTSGATVQPFYELTPGIPAEVYEPSLLSEAQLLGDSFSMSIQLMATVVMLSEVAPPATPSNSFPTAILPTQAAGRNAPTICTPDAVFAWSNTTIW